MNIVVFGVFFGLSLLLTYLYQKFAISHKILDIPNSRSSHTVAVPRGGGLAFVTVFLGALIFFIFVLPEQRALWYGLLGGGGLVAFIGWLDDKNGISAVTRFLVHSVAAIWAIFWLGGLTVIDLGFMLFELHLWGYLFGWLCIVWLLNLYNFMDGIDGLAAGEAFLVSSVAAFAFVALGYPYLAIASGTLSAAVGGFLYFNWPPAKVFMGDAGSGFLGFTFAVLALASANQAALPLLGWFVLLGVFIVDATNTLLKRIWQGENWYEAHRSHAYQKAVQQGHSHRQVTTIILLIGLFLAFLTLLILLWPQILALTFLFSMIVLSGLWWFINKMSNMRMKKPANGSDY